MPQTPRIIAQLVHIHGPLKGLVQNFSRFPVHVGRHSACQVRFQKDLTTISRRHARIERLGNRFRIIDASMNGTYVNGKRIADVYLRDGDVITFTENGPKASFLTKIEASRAPVVHAPSEPPQPSRTAPVQPQDTLPGPSIPPSQPNPPEPDLTAGPDLEIPVISVNAPLVIQFGPILQTYNLLPVTIGSDPDCDFVIGNDLLAGRHIQIFFSDNVYYAKDLTGQDVVSINERPIGNQSVLAQGAELSLTPQGPKFRFLGGGRLAQIPDEVSEPPETTDSDSTISGSDNDGLATAKIEK